MDDDGVDRTPRGLKLQAELLLDGGEDRGRGRVRVVLRRVGEVEFVPPHEPRFVEHGALEVICEDADEHRHSARPVIRNSAAGEPQLECLVRTGLDKLWAVLRDY